MSELKGILKVTKYGTGFISNESDKKIIVYKRNQNNNFNGDEVIYIVKNDTGKTQFVEIISEPKYKNKEFNGIVHHTYKKDVFIYNINIGCSNLVLCDCMIINDKKKKDKKRKIKKDKDISKDLNNNNFVKFIITKYKNGLFYGKVINNYGSFYDDNALSKYIIELYKLNYEFPKKVITKSEKCVNRYNDDKEEEMKKRKDLRYLNTFTIDPNGARDLDDAISIVKSDIGYKLYVHIADVSYFVKKGNSIDIESRKRSFSVYLPNQVIRMLPPLLSENLCSLLPDSDKYAVTTEVDIDSKGEVIKWDTYKSIIRSDYKYTYEEVYDIITNNGNNKYINELILLLDLSNLLKRNRLKLPEKKINDQFEMDISYSDFSHAMIEEMMILNNILVARTLSNKGISYPSRYHSEPKYDKNINLLEFVEKINDVTISKVNVDQLQCLVDVEDHDKKLINLLFIQRILSKAIYDCVDSGHWALNLDFYSHFTSPIRRYPDLISHRLIFGENYKDSTLKKYLNVVNDNEKNYQQIEFFMEKVRLIRHINKLQSKNKNKIFDGYILEVKNPNVTIFIPSLFWTQDFHIADITNTKMEYDDIKKIYYNDNMIVSGGTKIQMKIKQIKVAFLELEFEVNKI